VRVFIALVTIAIAAFTLNAARAFPDGAPWGAANPAAEQHCATCHFESDPVRESSSLVIEGLPARLVPGASYYLQISFDDPNIVIAGFQLFAHAGKQEAGTFASSDSNIEIIGAAIRSTAPVQNDEGVAWAVKWQAPDEVTLPIVFYIAATAANDDGSPFGDTIHYRSYSFTAD
jgi:hypothetical protein